MRTSQKLWHVVAAGTVVAIPRCNNRRYRPWLRDHQVSSWHATTFDTSTDIIRDWTSIVCAGVFVATCFFLVSAGCTVSVIMWTRKPPLLVTYLQFPIQVCFPCISVCRPRPASHANFHHVTDTFVNSLVVLIIVMILHCRHCDKHIVIGKANDANMTTRTFFSNCIEWLSFTWSLLHSVPKHRDFLVRNISQGSVATRLRCGGLFLIALLPIC